MRRKIPGLIYDEDVLNDSEAWKRAEAFARQRVYVKSDTEALKNGLTEHVEALGKLGISGKQLISNLENFWEKMRNKGQDKE